MSYYKEFIRGAMGAVKHSAIALMHYYVREGTRRYVSNRFLQTPCSFGSIQWELYLIQKEFKGSSLQDNYYLLQKLDMITLCFPHSCTELVEDCEELNEAFHNQIRDEIEALEKGMNNVINRNSQNMQDVLTLERQYKGLQKNTYNSRQIAINNLLENKGGLR